MDWVSQPCALCSSAMSREHRTRFQRPHVKDLFLACSYGGDRTVKGWRVSFSNWASALEKDYGSAASLSSSSPFPLSPPPPFPSLSPPLFLSLTLPLSFSIFPLPSSLSLYCPATGPNTVESTNPRMEPQNCEPNQTRLFRVD